MKTVTITNQKGGVGKTTISTHFSFFLRDRGAKVAFIDLDNQGNASATLQHSVAGALASDLFTNPDLIIPAPAGPGITLFAADRALVEMERADAAQVIPAFKANLAKIGEHFDYCIIDTAPTVGLRMTAALIASDYAVCPIEIESYSISGIKEMLQTITGVKQRWNPRLTFLGMLPNRFNPNSASQKANLEVLLKSYAQYMIPAKIGNRTSISDALGQSIPVWEIQKTAARDAGKEMRAVFDLVVDKMEKAA